MTTETLDKLYLEWSQFTQARTRREIELTAALTELLRCAAIPDHWAIPAQHALRNAEGRS